MNTNSILFTIVRRNNNNKKQMTSFLPHVCVFVCVNVCLPLTHTHTAKLCGLWTCQSFAYVHILCVAGIGYGLAKRNYKWIS